MKGKDIPGTIGGFKVNIDTGRVNRDARKKLSEEDKMRYYAAKKSFVATAWNFQEMLILIQKNLRNHSKNLMHIRNSKKPSRNYKKN